MKLLIPYSLCLLSSLSFAQNTDEMEHITIIGERVVHGSASIIEPDELQIFEHIDVHRALANVPGINFRPEEGYGLRPNISIRGTYDDRSGKVTLMEDGILIAPAPYAASSAYYFPTFGRVHSVEVLKGPSAITEGPYTIGGAINLISTPIPTSSSGFFNQEVGSDSASRTHAGYGVSTENVGFLLEGHFAQTDGFDTIEHVGGNTGFDKDDLLFKFRLNSDQNAAVYQQLDFKYQDSSEKSNQSYVGLSKADFMSNPRQRYGFTKYDLMDNAHDQVVVTYSVDFGDFNVAATTYENNFARDWFKVDKIGYNGAAKGINNMIDYANAGTADAIAVLRGTNTTAETIKYKHNNRVYVSEGTVIKGSWATDNQTLTFGYRSTEDSEDRMQWYETADWKAGTLSALTVGSKPGLSSNNRITVAKANAFFLNQELRLDNLTITGGVRKENWDINETRWNETARTSIATGYPKSKTDNKEKDETLFGFGAGYTLSNGSQVFFGYHQGFSPTTGDAKPETADSMELGWSGEIGNTSGSGFVPSVINMQAVYFNTDYQNIVGTCTNSASGIYEGCTIGDTFDGGQAMISGLELSASTSFTIASGATIPLMINFTSSDGKFDSSFESSYWGDVNKGMKLPNMPDTQLSLTTGLDMDNGWSIMTSLTSFGDTCSVASCATDTTIDSYSIIDLSINKKINERADAYLVIGNVTDSSDIIARAPKNGIRTQRPQYFNLGLRLTF
tara:strand:+ start:685 stop:2883 length:2199 start_codon:yes stop_codon:yes gene_type:complete